MSKNVFPVYDVTNLKGNLFINFPDGIADLKDISLERITIESGKKFIDNDQIIFNIIFGRTEIAIKGTIVNFRYARDIKKYEYKVNLLFDTLDPFNKWLAIVKGIHRARYNL